MHLSQAKVDAYKQQKKNRGKLMRREKRILFLEKLLGIVVAAAVIFWIGFSIYQYNDSQKEKTLSFTEVDLSAMTEFNSAIAEMD